MNKKKPQEIKLDRRPDNPLFGPAAEMFGDQRQREGGLEHEVPVAGHIQSVSSPVFKAQPPSRELAIDRQRRAGRGRRSRSSP